MRNGQNELKGNIANIRVIEDCIRATHQYTESIGTMLAQHPIQGGEFSSKVLCKHYEVYDIALSWDMPAGVALDWLWGDTSHINVTFKYDYRENKASFIVKGGMKAINDLRKYIPGFNDARWAVLRSG